MKQLALFMDPSRLSWKITSWLSHQIFNANHLISTWVMAFLPQSLMKHWSLHTWNCDCRKQECTDTIILSPLADHSMQFGMDSQWWWWWYEHSFPLLALLQTMAIKLLPKRRSSQFGFWVANIQVGLATLVLVNSSLLSKNAAMIGVTVEGFVFILFWKSLSKDFFL